MSSHSKRIAKILGGQSDANTEFEELRSTLRHLGFHETIRGSHHLFHQKGVVEKLNLQRDGRKAKVYQVRQVRTLILKYRLGGQD